MRSSVAILCVAAIAVGCGTTPSDDRASDSSDTLTTHYAPGTRRMERNVVNSTKKLSPSDYRRRLVDGYWDNFDFEADSAVVAYDTIDIVYAMADYVQLIEPERADSLMRTLMRRAEASRPVLDFFATISQMVLNDPNSPLRNDEYYIPVLEVLCESPLLDEYDRLAPAYDLEVARKNRIGTAATDFVYTLNDGRRQHLYDIEADYTLVMFNNPGCAMCKGIMEQITASPLLNELTEVGRLRTLAIYPDADIEAWKTYRSQMPDSWIVGYDAGQVITREELYNLRAIPALYLLDSRKRVIVKDGTDIAQIEYVIATEEAQRN